MDWKNLCKKLLMPPVWAVVLLAFLSVAALVAVFSKGMEQTVPAFVAYAVSFYTLTVTVINCVTVLPEYCRSAKRKIYNTGFCGRYLTDAVFKTHVSLYHSLAINLLYVLVNLISGMLYRSMWFVILAGYYTILSVIRFLLLRFFRNVGIGTNRLEELRRARLCAWILMLVNVALSGAVMMMMYQGRGVEYVGMLIYGMALYTFYITISAVIDLFKYRKFRSPVMSAGKVINLTAALVSMLNLETAMFAAFGTGDMSTHGERLMIALTGAGVSTVVIVLAIYIICRTGREIHDLNIKKQEEILYESKFL